MAHPSVFNEDQLFQIVGRLEKQAKWCQDDLQRLIDGMPSDLKEQIFSQNPAYQSSRKDLLRSRDVFTQGRLRRSVVDNLEKRIDSGIQYSLLYKPSFEGFRKDMEQLVRQAIENSEGETISMSSVTFQIGEKIRMNAGATTKYNITKEGSEGKIVGYEGSDDYGVEFTKLTGTDERRMQTLWVHKDFMERMQTLKELVEEEGCPDKLTQEVVKKSIDSAVQYLIEEQVKDESIKWFIKEMIDNKLLMKLEEDDYTVNQSGLFQILGKDLVKIYSNSGLYSSPDMFSPPSERKPHVLRFELTQGCDFNACTFCEGYKGIRYREKDYEQFLEHYEEVMATLGDYTSNIKRLFLGGGNALNIKQSTLIKVVKFLERKFDPKRIAIYGRADSITDKGKKNLSKLNAAGLGVIYWGVESGSDDVLEYVNKRTNAEQMRLAGETANSAGIDLSVMVMPGLGGIRHYDSHIEGTIEFLNNTETRFITFMGVNPSPTSKYSRIMEKENRAGTNRHLTERETIEQLSSILERLDKNGQKIGMFDHGIDQVGRNPLYFNVEFDYDGKREALGVCDRYLAKKAQDLNS